MKNKRIIAAGAGLLLAVTTLGLGGCHAEHYHRPAPPSHAPAHGYRWHHQDYFFYPSVGVYFHIHSGHYYYRDGRQWQRSLWLPPHIVLIPRDRVQLRIPDAEPWRHHHDYERRYRKRHDYRSDRDRHHDDRRERDYLRDTYRDYRR